MFESSAIDWMTPKGSKIRVEIKTSEANLADHNVTNPCLKLIVYANDRDMFLGAGFDVVDHAQFGPVLKPWFGQTLVPVPADKLEAVKTLIRAFKAEIDRRADVALAEDVAAQKHDAAVRALLAQ